MSVPNEGAYCALVTPVTAFDIHTRGGITRGITRLLFDSSVRHHFIFDLFVTSSVTAVSWNTSSATGLRLICGSTWNERSLAPLAPFRPPADTTSTLFFFSIQNSAWTTFNQASCHYALAAFDRAASPCTVAGFGILAQTNSKAWLKSSERAVQSSFRICVMFVPNSETVQWCPLVGFHNRATLWNFFF